MLKLKERSIETVVLLMSRLALASVFWLSGQTKVEGFALNILSGQWQLGIPHLKDTTLFLFEYEYALPIINATLAAYLATVAEHLLPIMLLLGVLTRWAALGIAIMTLTIQLFVYPSAYATHLTWLSLAGLLMWKGSGTFSIDHYWRKRKS
ncbi:DoxX family protein [Vibrio porteresiae]|uniref:DoxX family protein n=1 Tax=Vibrio porteresiae DSM 19223 TaxID=1123496 RepID=A0ABZ0QB81_9VIBR|nr:DoxX family protein [Vibrio porteresiae]WPC73691.1 DoxX family protein [Vibrio porteresiae DSM 19223]